MTPAPATRLAPARPGVRALLAVALAAACAPEPGAGPRGDLGGGKADRPDERAGDIVATALTIDLATRRGTAVLDVHPDGAGELSLEVAGLTGLTVDRPHRLEEGRLVVEGLEADDRVTVSYGFALRTANDGLLASGSTLLWPYHCGNLYPCHSQPADGLRFSLALTGVPGGAVAIAPARIEADAPPYMLAWAVGDYGHAELGATAAGTRVGVYWLPGGEAAARAGTAHLVEVVDWLEQHLGPYAFGDEVGSVAVRWGEGAFGGMEHHPFWHVAESSMDDEETHAHEAAHGWYGDAVRLRCWEDFVLSEGTVSYLAARALGAVAGEAAEAAIWRSYARRLDRSSGEGPVWPVGCDRVDILEDGLFSDAPYMRGAFFYKAVAGEIGAEALDEVLAAFYRERRGTAAGVWDMLVAIEEQTGFDAGPLATRWLR